MLCEQKIFGCFLHFAKLSRNSPQNIDKLQEKCQKAPKMNQIGQYRRKTMIIVYYVKMEQKFVVYKFSIELEVKVFKRIACAIIENKSNKEGLKRLNQLFK